MFRSYWSKNREAIRLAAIALGLLCAALVLYALGALVGQNLGYYDAQADGYAAQYPSDTDERVSKCFSQPDMTAVQQCTEDAIAAGREAQRSEQDLGAQRQMAKWALWLLILTAGQSLLGVFGFIVLLITIRQGREANDLTRRGMIYQNRAWLSVVKVELAIFANDAVALVLTIKNSGQSPAICISADASFHGKMHNPIDTNPDRAFVYPKSEGLEASGNDIAAGQHGFLSIHCTEGQDNGAETARSIKTNPNGLLANIELNWFDIFGTKSKALIQVLGPMNAQAEIGAAKAGKLMELHIANHRRVGQEEQTDYDLSPPGYEQKHGADHHDPPVK